jgi:hypothetical protein
MVWHRHKPTHPTHIVGTFHHRLRACVTRVRVTRRVPAAHHPPRVASV